MLIDGLYLHLVRSHPAAHGVLRLVVEMSGEVCIMCCMDREIRCLIIADK